MMRIKPPGQADDVLATLIHCDKRARPIRENFKEIPGYGDDRARVATAKKDFVCSSAD